MRLKLLKPCVVSGHPGVHAGEVFEVEDRVGEQLLAHRWAEQVKAEIRNPKSEGSQAGVIETRDPVIENREPAPASVSTQKKIRPGKRPGGIGVPTE